ncbi:hypothetical protein GYMLUDRAFT_74060 [Collybiopsis luxurians FD-317 M1]|uniref:Uncharacterized protein n=1 Tax=Collybiopsis luxurians FD-317 M1 TaxID=944289 RepID=A0A0D0CMZ0_9AGAR|nr:hypothetical protein GYMLUDRAFT_74060 [Collybiopsis luxurians FD-317 M1]
MHSQQTAANAWVAAKIQIYALITVSTGICLVRHSLFLKALVKIRSFNFLIWARGILLFGHWYLTLPK